MKMDGDRNARVSRAELGEGQVCATSRASAARLGLKAPVHRWFETARPAYVPESDGEAGTERTEGTENGEARS